MLCEFRGGGANAPHAPSKSAPDYVWQFNSETQLRQEVRRFCFNALRAFPLKMWKLPSLSDVRCFTNCRSSFLRFLKGSLQSSWLTCVNLMLDWF